MGDRARTPCDLTAQGARLGLEFVPKKGFIACEVPDQFGVASIDDTLRPLPGGLQIVVTLSSRISGDMRSMDAVVAKNVAAKRGGLLIAAGSPVRGRIQRLERYADPFPHFVVALEFTEVELHGIRYRFYADPIEIEPVAGVEAQCPVHWTTRPYYGGPDRS